MVVTELLMCRKAREELVSAVSDVMKEFSIDPDRVYVTGQSMGGIATWDLVVRHPTMFAAAVPICGIGDKTQAGKIQCPVWAFHGAKDGTVPVACSREMVAAMKAAGGTVSIRSIPTWTTSVGTGLARERLSPCLLTPRKAKSAHIATF